MRGGRQEPVKVLIVWEPSGDGG